MGLPGLVGQWHHPLAAGCLGEADRVASGEHDVRVMQEPVDGGVRDGFGHEFVEAGRVQVRRDRDGALLIRGIDDAVEGFGGVGRDRQKPDVVELCRPRHSSTYADTATMPTGLRPEACCSWSGWARPAGHW